MKINSHNEWDKLKEVVVGNPDTTASLVFPTPGQVPEQTLEKAYALAKEACPQYFVDEIGEDLEELCDVIRDFGAKVYRPNNDGLDRLYTTPNWSAAGNNVYNMRDLHLVVGDTVIESPSYERHRYFEATGLYDIWYEYLKDGFRWVAGPKPRLIGDYKVPFTEDGNNYTMLAENEIIFEAANTVRMGRDLLYLVSASGNYMGANWLQSMLGDEYKVHTTEGIYRSSHIDSTILCLRPGLVLINGYRVNDENCPEILDQWDKIYFDDIVPYPQEALDFQENVRKKVHHQLTDLGVESNLEDISSPWIGMNVLSLDSDTVVIDKRQTSLIKILEKHKLTVVPISFRHSYFMGGIHCSTLDTVRESKLERYFD